MRLEPYHQEWIAYAVAFAHIMLGEHAEARAIDNTVLAGISKDARGQSMALGHLAAMSSLEGIAGLSVIVTEARLIVDIAEGYDVVVMGADKWVQVNDPAWYDHDVAARDDAVARLPTVALAPRPPHAIPDRHHLPIPDDILEVSSTAARDGRVDWMTEAAAAFDAATGAWTDPGRYRS